jgi:biopolymer transport protein ExbD
VLYSAQRVRNKVRAAVKRREESIEQDEMESGELNLIPYLDMVTNLMLFLLASVSAGLILVQIDTTLPDKKPPSPTPVVQPSTNPDDQPLSCSSRSSATR